MEGIYYLVIKVNRKTFDCCAIEIFPNTKYGAFVERERNKFDEMLECWWISKAMHSDKLKLIENIFDK